MLFSSLLRRFALLSKVIPLEFRSSAKFLLVLGLLWHLPIAVMFLVSLRHLEHIEKVAVDGARNILYSSQTQLLKGRLSWEADRLSMVFSRIQDESYALASYTQTVISPHFGLSYRNGSRYRLVPGQTYCSSVDDGNSSLYAIHYGSGQDRTIAASESLDLVLKPLAARESRIVLGWFIHANGVCRAYPWRDFRQMPIGKVTNWPFYFLADPVHNPQKRVVFTPVYLDPLSHEWMISCLSPVYQAGKFTATVGLDLTIHDLLGEISSMRLSRGTGVLLLSGDEIIAASDNLPARLLGLDPSAPAHGQRLGPSSLPLAERLRHALSGEKEKIRLIEGGGFRGYIGYSPIPSLGWKIAILVPEHDFLGLAEQNGKAIMEDTKQIMVGYAHLLVFSLSGLILVSFLFFLHQSRGPRALLAGISRLEDGELSYRIPEERGEFGRLAKALNSMAHGLEEKKAELLRVHTEVEQERKLAAVGRLAAGVAHEVNNPLATISTYTQLLLRRRDLPEEVPEDLRKVMGEIQRIQTQLRNLLDLSRLQSPARTMQDPDTAIKEVADLARHEAAARQVELIVSLGGERREIPVDRSALKQVVWNLLDNALDAQQGGGRIWLRSYRLAAGESSEFVLEVEDEGPGIPDEIAPQIFEPFFTSKGFGQGTGLGLAVVHRIVKGHDGNISVQQRSPRGSLFRVVLPGTEGV